MRNEQFFQWLLHAVDTLLMSATALMIAMIGGCGGPIPPETLEMAQIVVQMACEEDCIKNPDCTPPTCPGGCDGTATATVDNQAYYTDCGTEYTVGNQTWRCHCSPVSGSGAGSPTQCRCAFNAD